MKWLTGFLATIAIATAVSGAAALQLTPDEQQALRARIEQRYDVVPLTDGLALRPKSSSTGVRLIMIADTITIDGVPVSGRELRERLGADADTILRVSYLDAAARRELFRATDTGKPQRPEAEAGSDLSAAEREMSERRHRSGGDRIRIFGDVAVAENEDVRGEVVAVMGSVRIDGEAGEVVAVLGSVDLGPHAIVRGDVTAVGGRVRRSTGAQVQGGVTEVSLADMGGRVNGVRWFDGWAPIYVWGDFGAAARLIFSGFRFVLLAFLACLSLLVARGSVEGSAHRLTENPVKATLVGVVAALLFAPAMILVSIILAISIIGIPLLILLPFAVLVLLLMALVGFSGAAYAVGQWTRRRFGIGVQAPFADVCLGVAVILMPVLVGRVLGLAGWPIRPLTFLLLAVGVGVEFLAWSSGFGAVLTNAFGRWQAKRAMRAPAAAPGSAGL